MMLLRSIIAAFVSLPSVLCSSSGRLEQGLLVAGKHQGLHLTHDLFAFHKNLTEIESISGNEKAVGDWLAESLSSQGYTVEKQQVSEDPLRFNVHAWPGEVRDARVLLSSHIDTVPPYYPYKRLSNGTISGRGSVDAKGSVAAQVVAVNKLITDGSISRDDVALLYVVGEEVNAIGMRTANDLKLKPETVIFGEPTEGKLASGHKGNLGLTITAKGKAAHSGYPWLGRSANEVLITALSAIMRLENKLPDSDKYGSTTFNIGKLEGGVAANVVAESAYATIAVRIAEGTPAFIKKNIGKAVYAAIQDFLDEDLKAEDIIDLDYTSAGYAPVNIDHDVSGFDVFTVNYGTDIPYFNLTGKNQKRYLYGPGSILVAHSDHEATTEDELKGAVQGYQRLVLHALGKDE